MNFAFRSGAFDISNGVKEKVLFSWSGGKESAFALYEIRNKPNYEIAALLTTVTVRRSLLEEQAESLGYAVEEVLIPKTASQEKYESAMLKILTKYKKEGVRSIAFGDIFLEDVRRQREDNLSKIEMEAIFPLWKNDTSERAATFIKLGFKARITCVDTDALDKSFAGRTFDEQFLAEIPSNVDPCGENGEFHSFVYDGPIFQNRISHKIGDICLRDNRFYYCDIIPCPLIR
jgi:uncharacterized protein (TIGR00290 family)